MDQYPEERCGGIEIGEQRSDIGSGEHDQQFPVDTGQKEFVAGPFHLDLFRRMMIIGTETIKAVIHDEQDIRCSGGASIMGKMHFLYGHAAEFFIEGIDNKNELFIFFFEFSDGLGDRLAFLKYFGFGFPIFLRQFIGFRFQVGSGKFQQRSIPLPVFAILFQFRNGFREIVVSPARTGCQFLHGSEFFGEAVTLAQKSPVFLLLFGEFLLGLGNVINGI
ncbi:MAG: hypothetical protein IJS14_13745 [Lentisphaeria bacterium]|nr:hypothetical protein [Lentisphaeria bacterium]